MKSVIMISYKSTDDDEKKNTKGMVHCLERHGLWKDVEVVVDHDGGELDEVLHFREGRDVHEGGVVDDVEGASRDVSFADEDGGEDGCEVVDAHFRAELLVGADGEEVKDDVGEGEVRLGHFAEDVLARGDDVVLVHGAEVELPEPVDAGGREERLRELREEALEELRGVNAADARDVDVREAAVEGGAEHLHDGGVPVHAEEIGRAHV